VRYEDPSERTERGRVYSRDWLDVGSCAQPTPFWIVKNSMNACEDPLCRTPSYGSFGTSPKQINEGLADPKMKVRFADLGGGVLMPMTPTDFGKLVADETEKWGKVIRAANIKRE
jgi:hypothetical protein